MLMSQSNLLVFFFFHLLFCPFEFHLFFIIIGSSLAWFISKKNQTKHPKKDSNKTSYAEIEKI